VSYLVEREGGGRGGRENQWVSILSGRAEAMRDCVRRGVAVLYRTGLTLVFIVLFAAALVLLAVAFQLSFGGLP